jgi:integrase/recombinase XerD
MSLEEVSRFFDAVDSLKHRFILTVCYAAGLRVSEAVRLTPGAIDSQRMVIRVEAGKGRKDRYVMLSPRLLDILRGRGSKRVVYGLHRKWPEPRQPRDSMFRV